MTRVAICITLPTMDAKAIPRAALVTLRRPVLQNFPPGPERDRRLEWLARAVSGRQEAMRALMRLKHGLGSEGPASGMGERGEAESARQGHAVHQRRGHQAPEESERQMDKPVHGSAR
jgi:hypothetical protein